MRRTLSFMNVMYALFFQRFEVYMTVFELAPYTDFPSDANPE